MDKNNINKYKLKVINWYQSLDNNTINKIINNDEFSIDKSINIYHQYNDLLQIKFQSIFNKINNKQPFKNKIIGYLLYIIIKFTKLIYGITLIYKL